MQYLDFHFNHSIKLTEEEMQLIEDCINCDRFLCLIEGKDSSYVPKSLFTDLPIINLDAIAHLIPLNNIPKDYRYWFGFFCDIWGDSISFWYPQNTRKGKTIYVLCKEWLIFPSGDIWCYRDSNIEWTHGKRNLVKALLQPCLWEWLLSTRGNLIASEAQVNELTAKIKRMKQSITTKEYYRRLNFSPHN